MVAQKRTKQQKPAPSEGEAIATGYGREVPEKVTAENIPKFVNNIHYADNKQNLMIQIFPSPPEIWTTGPDGETDEDRTSRDKETFEAVRGYAAMQIAVSDILDYGASVKSPGIARIDGEYTLAEIRNLPARSLALNPGSGRAVNPLMPGITVRDGETEVYQFDASRGTTQQIWNFVIVKQAETPEPSGKAYSLPIYPVIAEIDFANKAATQQVNRVGAPIIMPKANDEISADDYRDLIEWHRKFGTKWGKDTSFLIPPGVEFPDLKIKEGTTARDFVEERVRWVRFFFNPTTDLDSSGTAIGASDSGRMEIWANYIASWQSLAETWLERLFDACHAYNGRDGYHTHIQLKRPSVDRSAAKLQYIQGLVSAKAITVEEIRDNATDILDLRETSAEMLLQLREQYPASSMVGLFGNTTEGFTRPEDQIMAETEKKILAANDASRKAIAKIMNYAE